MEEEQLQDSLDVVHAYREIQRKKSYDVWNLDCRLKGELSFTETNSKLAQGFWDIVFGTVLSLAKRDTDGNIDVSEILIFLGLDDYAMTRNFTRVCRVWNLQINHFVDAWKYRLTRFVIWGLEPLWLSPIKLQKRAKDYYPKSWVPDISLYVRKSLPNGFFHINDRSKKIWNSRKHGKPDYSKDSSKKRDAPSSDDEDFEPTERKFQTFKRQRFRHLATSVEFLQENAVPLPIIDKGSYSPGRDSFWHTAPLEQNEKPVNFGRIETKDYVTCYNVEEKAKAFRMPFVTETEVAIQFYEKERDEFLDSLPDAKNLKDRMGWVDGARACDLKLKDIQDSSKKIPRWQLKKAERIANRNAHFNFGLWKSN